MFRSVLSAAVGFCTKGDASFSQRHRFRPADYCFLSAHMKTPAEGLLTYDPEMLKGLGDYFSQNKVIISQLKREYRPTNSDDLTAKNRFRTRINQLIISSEKKRDQSLVADTYYVRHSILASVVAEVIMFQADGVQGTGWCPEPVSVSEVSARFAIEQVNLPRRSGLLESKLSNSHSVEQNLLSPSLPTIISMVSPERVEPMVSNDGSAPRSAPHFLANLIPGTFVSNFFVDFVGTGYDLLLLFRGVLI